MFGLGCGNDTAAHHLSARYQVAGIEVANRNWAQLRLEVGPAYEDLGARFGTFDAVVSLAVIEHLYDPRL